MYVLEYGDGYFAENPDAPLSKINFVRGNHSPLAKVSANPAGGQAPLTVTFSQRRRRPTRTATSFVRLGLRRRRQGRLPRAEPGLTLTKNGALPADAEGDRQDRAHRPRRTRRCWSATSRRWSSWSRPHRRPAAPFHFGDTVTYTVTVTDDQPVDCKRSSWPTSSVTSSTATRSPRPRAARARSPCRWTRPRRRGQPERHLRRQLHRQRGPQRHRRGPVRRRRPLRTAVTSGLDGRGPAFQLGRGRDWPGCSRRPAGQIHPPARATQASSRAPAGRPAARPRPCRSAARAGPRRRPSPRARRSRPCRRRPGRPAPARRSPARARACRARRGMITRSHRGIVSA